MNLDFDELAINYDQLRKFTFLNENGITVINWNDREAMICLNQAILKYYWGI
jgi:hypothetical protein